MNSIAANSGAIGLMLGMWREGRLALEVIGAIGLVLTHGLEWLGTLLMPWRERTDAGIFG